MSCELGVFCANDCSLEDRRYGHGYVQVRGREERLHDERCACKYRGVHSSSAENAFLIECTTYGTGSACGRSLKETHQTGAPWRRNCCREAVVWFPFFMANNFRIISAFAACSFAPADSLDQPKVAKIQASCITTLPSARLTSGSDRISRLQYTASLG